MDTALHYIMSYIGGFLGVYTILLRGGNFGSAQTGNMIYLVTGWFGGSFQEMVIRVIALIIFTVSMIAAYLLPNYVKGDIRRTCIWVEIVGVVLAGFLPAEMNNVVALYPIFAVSAFQWGVFGGARGYNSATTFSTNNLKQMVLALTDYVRTKERKEKEKAVFYAATLLSFQIGVLGGFAAVREWQIAGIWSCLIPLGAALTLVEFKSARVRVLKKKMAG